MRLAISNIAWEPHEDAEVAALLQNFGIDAIDVAPGKYFADPVQAKTAQIRAVGDWWAQHGIEITGMQSLLFGTTGLNSFGPAAVQTSMLRHLNDVFRIGAGLGATRLVFGSPRNRDRNGLDDDAAMAMAIEFFRKLGGIASDHGVVVCLEPNPTRYGANFMTTCAETANVVRNIAHPAIRMQFDTGALTVNGEVPMAVLDECAALIGHVHVSEPDLLPIGDGDTDHALAATAVRRHLPQHVVSVEMVASRDEPHLSAIERALVVAVRHYRGQDNRNSA